MAVLRVATLMRASTNKQGTAGQKKRAKDSKRKSLIESTDETDLPLQREKIKEFIDSQPQAKDGITWVHSGIDYIESGVSGFKTHMSKRQVLSTAFEDAKAGKYDVLLMYKLDRFGRRASETAEYLNRFLKHTAVWTVDKGDVSSSNEYAELVIMLELWMARQSSKDTQMRVKDEMLIIHKTKGAWTGGNPPYGYTTNSETRNMLQQIPEQVAVVKEIYSLYVNKGYGMLKIAGKLNESGHKTKTGKDWKADSVRKVLRNSIYMGYLSYGKTKTVEGEWGSYQRYTKAGEENISTRYWPEYDIIGKDVWEQAQKKKKDRVENGTGFGSKNRPKPTRKGQGLGILVGLMKCECGGNMSHKTTSDWGDSKRTWRKPPYRIYHCQVRHKSGVKACGADKGMYRAVELEQKVIDEVEQYLKKTADTNLIENIKEKTRKGLDDTRIEIEQLKAEIEENETIKSNAMAQLTAMLKVGFADGAEILGQAKREAEEKLVKLQARYTELEKTLQTDSKNDIDPINVRKALHEWRKIFDQSEIEQKKELLRCVINYIQLDNEEVNVNLDIDILKFFEAMGTARNAIISTVKPSLLNGDSRSSYSNDITGMKIANFTAKIQFSLIA